jgi:hypothetical protein
MTDEEWNAIRPGAPRAKELGCKCPEEQPYHESHGAYFVKWSCELHQGHDFPSMGMLD